MNDQAELYRPAIPRILIMEKDRGLAKSISLTLQCHGMKVARVYAEMGLQAYESEDPPDVIVVDFDSFPEISGKWIEKLRKRSSRKPISVIVTSSRRMEDRWRSRYRPDLVLYKPYDIRFLFRSIRSLL